MMMYGEIIMMNLDGISYFTLLVDESDYQLLHQIVNKYQNMMEIIRSYEVGISITLYYVVEVGMVFENRSNIDLCKYAINYFPCIALHQEGSSYILVNDKDQFKEAVLDGYGAEQGEYFLYDMLTIGERYKLCFLTVPYLQNAGSLRLHYAEGATLYSLCFDMNCQYIFTEESNLQIENEMTGEIHQVDLIEGMKKLKFHIVILE